MPRSIFIIDGHAQIFRAYFAPMRPLTSPTGEPTKATYVFMQSLLQLLEQHKPDYLVMVVDTGKRDLFRTKLYPEYKANRPAPPPDFKPQEQRIIKIVTEAGIPVLSLPGFEADDIMATIAHHLAEEDFRVVLVSKDKDLRQLVTDKVVLLDAATGKTLDPAGVEEEFGYPPSKAVDIQTLTGDTTDNVPGIPGVGEKTAAKLLKQYGSAEEIYQHLEELTPKLRENLKAHAEVLTISRQLVTLRKDVPIEIKVESYRYQGLNQDSLVRNFSELGFTALLKRLGLTVTPAVPKPAADPFAADLFGNAHTSSAAAPAGEEPAAAVVAMPTALETSADCDYRLVNTPETLAGFLAELKQQKLFAFDTETDALGAMASNIVGMSFSWKAKSGYYVAIAGPLGGKVLAPTQVIDALRPILEDPTMSKVGHNIKYDALGLRKMGVQLRGICLDSMIAAFVLDSSRDSFSMDRLAAEQLGFRKIATQELIGSGKNQISMQQVPLEHVARYAAEDADITLRLARLFRQQLDANPALGRLYDELENPLIDVLIQMEFNGVSIDPAMLREQSRVLGERIEQLRRKIMEEAGCEFNPDSPKQLADVLFNRLQLPVMKKNKTGPSTDVEVLEKLAIDHEVPRLMLDHRSLVKLKNTYLDTLTQYVNPGTQRIHASFSQIGAETGRLSCTDPNLQNIPIRTDEGRRIRLAFVPADRGNDVLLTADYSQIELRVLAHFTREGALVNAFKANQDIHAAVAGEVFGVPQDQVTKEQRSQAKVVNFGIIYGISAFGLARRIDGLGVQAAQKLIDAYHARFPTILQFLKTCVEQAKSQGYVETILSRRRYLPLIHSGVVAQRNAAERMAINSVVQGSAADLIKRAMVNIQRRIDAEHRPLQMLLQVHDELVFEMHRSDVEQQSEFIRQEMENAIPLAVPVKVDIGWGANWEEGK